MALLALFPVDYSDEFCGDKCLPFYVLMIKAVIDSLD